MLENQNHDQFETMLQMLKDMKGQLQSQQEQLHSIGETQSKLSDQLRATNNQLHVMGEKVEVMEEQVKEQNRTLLRTSSEMSTRGAIWYPNKKQIEEVLSEKFRKCSNRVIKQKMENNEIYDVFPNANDTSGYCLIVNIKTDRPGSEYDVSCLKYLMQIQFLMQVDVLQDCTAVQLNEKIDQLLSSDHLNRFKYVAAFLMAHGEGDQLQMADGQWICYREAVEYRLGDCDALAGKPKLLFIEACQGPQQDKGHISFDDTTSKGKPVDATISIKMADSTPKRADMVVVRATHAPIRAARHNQFGTFFIQAVCQVLKVDAHCTDILALCAIANSLMRSIEIHHSYQIPMVSSTLAKPFYFYCQGQPATKTVLIVGGYSEFKKNFDLELVCGNEIKTTRTLTYKWVFNEYEGFLQNDSVFGYAGFKNTEATLLQLHLPTMCITEVAQHPQAFQLMSTCQLDKSNLFVTTGGHRNKNKNNIYMVEAYMFDTENINTDSPFRQLPNMRLRRLRHSLIHFNSKIIAIGGKVDGKVDSILCDYLIMDAAEERWLEAPCLSAGREAHTSAMLDGRIFVAGGCKENLVEFLDDRMEKWQKIAPMNHKRSCFPLTVINGQLLASGGWNGDYLKSTEYYDARMDRWLSGPNMVKGRDWHVAVAIPEVVLDWS